MGRLSISRAWDETRGVLGSDGKLLTTVALALILLPQTVTATIAPPKELSGQDAPSWIGLLALLVGLIGIIAQIAIVRLALRSGTSVGDAISRGAKRVLPAFGAVMLFVLATILVITPILMLAAGGEHLPALAAGKIPPSLAWVILLLIAVLLLVGVRLQMIVPAASEEAGGPIRLLKRSWELTRGNYWRLLGFLLIVLICALVVLYVAGIMSGLLARTIFGDIEPLSFGALVVALLTAAVQAAFSVVITVMLARIYGQLAGAGAAQLAEPSVPNSGT